MNQTLQAPSTFDPVAYLRQFEQLAAAAGFRVEAYGEIASVPLLAATRRTPGVRPRIYVSAGIHGDEPAGPLAISELLRRNRLDDGATWFVCPLLNPAGFLRRTRENADGIDLNRDYRALRSAEIRAHARWLKSQPNFDLALCLHEDWESTGYYLYELNPAGGRSFARAMLDAVCPTCAIETAAVIDGREISETGIIRPVSDPALRDLWPESIYLRAHHTKLSYTLESPSALPLERRVAAHMAAVSAAVAGVVANARPGAGNARSG